jgi:hypothetical protein
MVVAVTPLVEVRMTVNRSEQVNECLGGDNRPKI